MASKSEPPVGRSRFFKLAGLTVDVASGYAGSRLRRMFQSEEQARAAQQASLLRAGRRVAEVLGELKGAAMKMGQMASMAADLLPAEVSDALKTLQREAPPVDFSVIERQIQREFDQPIAQLFDDFEREPFASASIGQVHRARLDGRDLVCKVQYPGVDEAVRSDMRQLKVALLASGLLRIDRRAFDRSFEEIKTRLDEELDYCIEADNVRRFAAFHRRHPFVRVPDVIGHRCAKRVLTLAFEGGDSLADFDALGYTQAERDLSGLHLWNVLEAQLFELGEVHADPNPANFAFRRDGTLVMYDFGCVKRLPELVPDSYRRFVVDGLREDYAAVEATLRELGVRASGGSEVPASFYKMWRDWLALPILAQHPFDFGSARFEREAISTLLPATLRYMTSFQPAGELVFLNRALVGHYATLRKMRARVPVQALLRERIPETAPWFAER